MKRVVCEHCHGVASPRCAFCFDGTEVVLDRSDVVQCLQLLKQADEAGVVFLGVLSYGVCYAELEPYSFQIAREQSLTGAAGYYFRVVSHFVTAAHTAHFLNWPELAEFFEYFRKRHGRAPRVPLEAANLLDLVGRWKKA